MNIVTYLLAGALLLSVAFFGGYRYATNEYTEQMLAQHQAVADAVLAKEQAIQEAARTQGQLVEARRARGDAITDQVMAAISALPTVTNEACEFTPDTIRLLNQAGSQ